MNARWLPLVAIGLVAGLHVRLRAQASPLGAAQASPHPFQATDYYKLASVGEPRPAPDGRRIAFVVTTVVEDRTGAIPRSGWRPPMARARRSATPARPPRRPVRSGRRMAH